MIEMYHLFEHDLEMTCHEISEPRAPPKRAGSPQSLLSEDELEHPRSIAIFECHPIYRSGTS
jgi:hypothetical protein